ncbi:MAG TPA: HAD-IIIA family hydrolase [Oligoflexia bacterium]|nr:HAD-IIIA family hydrolase [Oligoflexia bacterium]HMP48082.1 HAD-IIIA family hydrolase [Oligoflexia bacterium]
MSEKSLNNSKPAVFLDRDGTINEDLDHVFQKERLILIKGAASAIGDLNRAGYLVIVVTNQSCIGRGFATTNQVNETNEHLQYILLKEDDNAHIAEFKVAPDHPDKASSRRKPGPGMIFEAVKDFNISLSDSWIIGDKKSDPESGYNAGIPGNQCILLKSGDEKKESLDSDISKPDFRISESLREAVDIYILKRSQ